MVKTKNGNTFSVTRNGKELDESLYTWDDLTSTFTTEERDLVIDANGVDEVTFNVGARCNIITGSNCTFKTGFSCTFKTGYGCTFKTSDNCTFNTGSYCTFNTGSYCTFKTGSDCTFNTGSDCTFRTGDNCTLNTGFSCTFKTGSSCKFNTAFSCTFDTAWNCTFMTASDCTFMTGMDCTFDTDSDCTFKTGFRCTFNTGSNCIFNTDLGCTFKTGDNCVAVRRDIFEVIKLPKDKKVQLCSNSIPGYIKDGFYYKNNKKQYKAIIADRILSEIINHKGNVYRVKNYSEEEITYLVKDGDIYSHGKTLEEARENLKYKISNRDTSMYKGYTLETEITLEQAIKMYRTITGACETGVKYFVKNNEIPSKMTVKELIKITQGQYGNRELVEFFGGK